MNKKLFIVLSFVMSLFSSGAEFLLIYPDARGAVFGSGMVAISKGEEGVYWNPASISLERDFSISGTHSEWFQGMRFDYFSLIFPYIGIGQFGLGGKAFYILDIEKRTEYSVDPEGTYSVIFSNFNISYSRSIRDNLGVGITGKFIYGKIDIDDGISFATDFGIMYTGEKVNLGFVVKNIGTPMKFIKEKDPLPLVLKSGISYNFLDNSFFVLGYSYNIPDKWGGFSAALEYSFRELVFLRAGYNSLFSDIDGFKGFSFGVGVNVIGFKIDYSITPYGVLGLTHRFTISYSLQYAKKRRLELKRRLIAETRKELIEKEKLTSDTYYKEGKIRYEEGDLGGAKKMLDIALIWYPENDKAKSLLKVVEKKIFENKLDKLFTKLDGYLRKKDYPSALSTLSEILKIDPDNKKAIVLRDSVNSIIKRQAKLRAQKAKERERIENYFKKGLYYFEKQDFQKAIAYFEKVISIFPGHKEAKDYMDKSRKALENSYSRYIELARANMSKNRLIDAMYFAKKALGMKKTSESKKLYVEVKNKLDAEFKKLLNQAKYEYTKGNFNKAYELALKAKDIYPENKEIKELLKKIEREKRAERDLDKLYLMGIEAYIKDDYRTALSYWKKILEIDPEYPNARKNYERALAKLKELQKK
jgi:tetratricopeptide (TPR) repeat protein